LSALDVIMQRQVPARPPVRQNEAAASTSGGDSSNDDPFSRVLSDQQRPGGEKPERADASSGAATAADREPVDASDATDPAAADESSAKGNSDEVLALLDGLMSSTANPGEVPVGDANAGAGNLNDSGDEAAIPVAPAEMAADAAQDEQAAPQPDAAKPGNPQGREPATGATAAQTHPHLAATANPAAAVAGTVAANRPQGNDAPQERSEKKPSNAAQTLRSGSIGTDSAPARPESDKPLILEGRIRAAAEGRQQEDRLDGKAQNVEVLESRRFVAAQAMGGNAQMLTRSLADTAQQALQTQHTAPAQSAAIPGQPQTGQMLHTLKLQLNPASLGSVTAVLKLSGEELTVDIKVQTAEAYRQLSDDNQAILKALRAQGFGVEQISIQHVVGPDRSANQAQQQAGQQNSFQGPGSGDAQASGREAGGQGGRNQFGSQHEGQGHDQKPFSSPDARRSDGVYL
jgi:chemotaxis protein MotD